MLKWILYLHCCSWTSLIRVDLTVNTVFFIKFRLVHSTIHVLPLTVHFLKRTNFLATCANSCNIQSRFSDFKAQKAKDLIFFIFFHNFYNLMLSKANCIFVIVKIQNGLFVLRILEWALFLEASLNMPEVKNCYVWILKYVACVYFWRLKDVVCQTVILRWSRYNFKITNRICCFIEA